MKREAAVTLKRNRKKSKKQQTNWKQNSVFNLTAIATHKYYNASFNHGKIYQKLKNY